MANRYLLKYKSLLNKLAMPVTFILIGVVARVVPHLPNFTPIGAMALFGGVYMSKKQALLLPLLAMFFSDFIIGFDSIPMRFAVYGSFLLIILMGMFVKNRVSIKNVVFVSLFASILFFITTNFAVWAFGNMYSKTIGGLIQSYILAIPFFRNTVLGDLFYSGIFFGVYNLLLNISPRVALARKRE